MKTAIVMTIALAAGALVAGDLKINGEFKILNPAKTAPAGWTKNFANQKDIGTSKIVPARKAGENAFQVTTTSRETPFYTGASYPIKPGNKVKIEADVKGKGTAILGAYIYDAKGGFITSFNVANKKVSDTFSEIKGEFIVQKEYDTWRNKAKVKVVPANVRIVFSAAANSDIVFEDVEAEVDAD
jgi:hypothetical protein